MTVLLWFQAKIATTGPGCSLIERLSCHYRNLHRLRSRMSRCKSTRAKFVRVVKVQEKAEEKEAAAAEEAKAERNARSLASPRKHAKRPEQKRC